MSAMNGGSLWRSCMGLLSMKRALQNQNTRSFFARGGSLGLELEVGNLTYRSVVSKVLISEAKESGRPMAQAD